MRTHLLAEIAIEDREKVLEVEPEFDFYRLKHTRALRIEFDTEADTSLSSLVLVTEYQAEFYSYVLTIRFESIRELILPPMQPFLWLTEFEIEDVRDRMMEGIGFEAITHFDGSFRCSCLKIKVISFERIFRIS